MGHIYRKEIRALIKWDGGHQILRDGHKYMDQLTTYSNVEIF